MIKDDLEIVAVEKENQKGASLVEYALLVALIAVIAIVAVRTLGQQASIKFSVVANQINGA